MELLLQPKPMDGFSPPQALPSPSFRPLSPPPRSHHQNQQLHSRKIDSPSQQPREMKENAGVYGLRKNPKKTWRSLHRLHLPDLHHPPRVPLGERRAAENVDSSSSISCIDDREVVEAALSLVMISKDRWDRRPEEVFVKIMKVEEIEKEGGEQKVRRRGRRRKKGHAAYGCATCGKTFRSHQALGGHCAGAHRRSRRQLAVVEAENQAEGEEVVGPTQSELMHGNGCGFTLPMG